MEIIIMTRVESWGCPHSRVKNVSRQLVFIDFRKAIFIRQLALGRGIFCTVFTAVAGLLCRGVKILITCQGGIVRLVLQ